MGDCLDGSVEEIFKKRCYEMAFFSEYEYYSIPEGFSFDQNNFFIRFGKKRFDLVYDFREKILKVLHIFSEDKKIKKTSFFSGKYLSRDDKSLQNYFFSNLFFVLSQENSAKDEDGKKIYNSFNIETKQVWEVYVIGGLIKDFKVVPLEDYFRK
jgi:hypothetical protein